MICYRDMTFCKFYRDCKLKNKCGRALTERVERQAEKNGLPVCQFCDKPECWKEEG